MSQANEYFDSVASTLSNGGCIVQRRVQSEKYLFDFVATNPPSKFFTSHTRNQIVVVASLLEIESPDQVADFSSFVMKYVLDNARELQARGDVAAVSVIVAEAFGDEVKRWVSETTPNRSVIKDRFEFPVLVEIQSQQLFYFRKKSFVAGVLYKDLREFADKYLGFSR